ncbi:serine/threonine-protein kinase [Ramlibacter sp. PS3R-8]|uniref:serine/threonine-protein kinase n=1 Tax=Ramlibacter sp. PS3R-8 TaxID=3133437 RepID=UPI0030B79469
MLNAPFTHLGRYRLLRELGRGAMGVVFLAEDDSLQRQVAIKTLLVPGGEGPDGEHREARFHQEAKAAGGLNHPNVVTIHDLGREGPWLYIAMEVLEGVELRDRMMKGPIALEEALHIAAQVASGLAAAHARGIVHRDVKPGNIMLLAGGHVKIMDFGIARMQTSEVRTVSGTMMGSPKYMSPEQVGGHSIDHRSDIFSLGSVLYEMVVGAPAFAGSNIGQLLTAILHSSPLPASQARPGVPASVELVIARAMHKNPQQRYQDAAEMAHDLVQCRNAVLRGGAARMDLDLLLASGAYPASAPWSLVPAAGFDASAAMKELLAAANAPAPSGVLRRMAWFLGYAAAAAAAIALAFR